MKVSLHDPLVLIDALRKSDEYIEIIYNYGGCWQFYKFLKAIFPEASAYKVSTNSLSTDTLGHWDHIITKVDDKFYDISGVVMPKDFNDFARVKESDKETFEEWGFAKNNLLSKQCPHCKEEIYINTKGEIYDGD
jgi:hypothetical protein